MLPTILTQRGIPLTDAIAFQLVQAVGGFFGYSSCSFLIDRYGRRPVLFLYYFVGAFFHLAFAMSTDFVTYVTAFLVGWEFAALIEFLKVDLGTFTGRAKAGHASLMRPNRAAPDVAVANVPPNDAAAIIAA
jgi:predicted MFS family arabinose efflux permease